MNPQVVPVDSRSEGCAHEAHNGYAREGILPATRFLVQSQLLYEDNKLVLCCAVVSKAGLRTRRAADNTAWFPEKSCRGALTSSRAAYWTKRYIEAMARMEYEGTTLHPTPFQIILGERLIPF